MARTKAVWASPPTLLHVWNRQKTRRLNLPLLRQLLRRLLEEWPPGREQSGGQRTARPAASWHGGQVGVHFVQAAEMARLNEQFLGHAGSTDVLAFDYREEGEPGGTRGEIFISVDDAVAGAPRFRATWQLELARYLVHGLLHLRGYDDRGAAARREMKQEENRLLKALSRRFDWSKLERAENVVRRK